MATFLEAVDSISDALLEYRQVNSKNAFSWSSICKNILRILKNYPTGITKPVLLSELLLISNRPKHSLSKNVAVSLQDQKLVTFKRILDIFETNQVELNSVLECFIKERVELEGSHTFIAKLAESNKLIDTDAKCIEMYLHQKIKCCEEIFNDHPVLMTGLRLHKLENKGIYRLLPTEFIVPVLNYDKDKDFIEAKFSTTIEGIHENDEIPHYAKNILVTIKEICPLETVHFPFRDSVHRSVVILSDRAANEIKLYLWDEKIFFVNLFNQGDTLLIEEPFLVNENGDLRLEYGPATVFYIVPKVESTELVPSQLDNAAISHVKMTVDRKLDFSSYQVRFTSKDFKNNSINICFLCTVIELGKKKNFQENDHIGHSFPLTVEDEFGNCLINVFDQSLTLHQSIYPGQMIFLENISVDDAGCFFLKTWEDGHVYNISSMKGYISSPCLYKLGTNFPIESHVIVDGQISAISQGEYCKSYCIAVHSSCLGPVEETDDFEYHCPRCFSSSLEFEPGDTMDEPSQSDVANLWIWRFSLQIHIETSSCKKETICCEPTEQFCQELLQVSSRDFSAMDRRKQESILNNQLGRSLLFSLSCSKHLKLHVNTFVAVPDSFIKNL
eukprot:gene17639-19394_t